MTTKECYDKLKVFLGEPKIVRKGFTQDHRFIINSECRIELCTLVKDTELSMKSRFRVIYIDSNGFESVDSIEIEDILDVQKYYLGNNDLLRIVVDDYDWDLLENTTHVYRIYADPFAIEQLARNRDGILKSYSIYSHHQYTLLRGNNL